MAAGLLALAGGMAPAPSLAATPSAGQALQRFAAAWANVRDYRATLTAREVQGHRIQDRVYHITFQKPHETRLSIVKGPGKGGVLVWRGGPTARGHQGGWLSFIDLTLPIHASRATSLRGITIAQANFGYLLHHVRSLETRSLEAKTRGDETEIDAVVADPSSDDGITRELLVLGASGLPVEYRQLEGSRVVRAVSYRNVKVNVEIPASAFHL